MSCPVRRFGVGSPQETELLEALRYPYSCSMTANEQILLIVACVAPCVLVLLVYVTSHACTMS
jgi:hypothetical protein